MVFGRVFWILARLRRHLHPDGLLFMGAAETTVMVDDAWQPERFGRSVGFRLRQS